VCLEVDGLCSVRRRNRATDFDHDRCCCAKRIIILLILSLIFQCTDDNLEPHNESRLEVYYGTCITIIKLPLTSFVAEKVLDDLYMGSFNMLKVRTLMRCLEVLADSFVCSVSLSHGVFVSIPAAFPLDGSVFRSFDVVIRALPTSCFYSQEACLVSLFPEIFKLLLSDMSC
jgi:hypothetical protein